MPIRPHPSAADQGHGRARQGEPARDTADFFLVVRGRLTIQLRDRDVTLEQGELFVVPRGVEHFPKADEETLVLLIEPRGTRNTGDVESELTRPEGELI